MKINKENLLVLDSILWFIAGFNVLKIGVETYPPYLTILNLAISLVIFIIFEKFIFAKSVRKNTLRIQNYKERKQSILHFFDKISLLIMVFMIGLGISVRSFNLAPPIFKAVFYTGLGASLFLAGGLFGQNYLKTKHVI